MEQLQHPPERVVFAACLSWCDLSEVAPHGSTLFQIRLRLFFPKKDRPGLFTPGEKPFCRPIRRAFQAADLKIRCEATAVVVSATPLDIMACVFRIEPERSVLAERLRQAEARHAVVARPADGSAEVPQPNSRTEE